MGKKRIPLNAIQGWLHTKSGQTFLNLAYSWGASIVILGALFKLTHIAGADLMLFIGMGTEVFVFFLSGFDVPWEDDDDDTVAEPAQVANGAPVMAGGPVIAGGPIGGAPIVAGGGEATTGEEGSAPVAQGSAAQGPIVIGGGAPAQGPVVVGGGAIGGGTIIIGGGGTGYVPPVSGEGAGEQPATIVMGSGEPSEEGTEGATVDPAALAASISSVKVPLYPGMTPEMQEATQAYVDQLNELTDILKQVAEQSARLTRDSEEMETMNRTLTGINRFYEMQLRSVGQQSSTIDDVNTQTKLLAEKLAELNGLYERMVDALKIKIG